MSTCMNCRAPGSGAEKPHYCPWRLTQPPYKVSVNEHLYELQGAWVRRRETALLALAASRPTKPETRNSKLETESYARNM